MSTVTIFCREGACNVPGHVWGNCYNRYAAVATSEAAHHSHASWAVLRPVASGPDVTGRQREGGGSDAGQLGLVTSAGPVAGSNGPSAPEPCHYCGITGGHNGSCPVIS